MAHTRAEAKLDAIQDQMERQQKGEEPPPPQGPPPPRGPGSNKGCVIVIIVLLCVAAFGALDYYSCTHPSHHQPGALERAVEFRHSGSH